MASFLESAGAGMALAGLMMTGCYAQRPLDEELAEERADASALPPDAGAPVADAGAPRCSDTDPIALLLCQLTPPASAQQPQAGIPDLTGLLNSLGGLGNIAQVLGPVVGTTTGRPATPAQGGLVDLVNLAGGLANIAQLFNQLLGGASQLTALFEGTAQPNQQLPSIADFLNGLGIPVAGPDTTLTQEPTADECAKPATPAQQFACALQQAQ
ncbi:MAG TPA: hypothetical protein VFX59_19195 [Polyangiales bacterium]|nr:hypothetical protein [Polyangiales bacterium]